jgi:DNA-binding SARP family transcriptional activator/tetratricopeptide (TPR) repeat protein
MQFRILGPVEVVDVGAPVAVGGRRDRAVLAALLLRADRPVSLDSLVDAVWDDPPPTASKQVRNTVARLRQVLACGQAAAIETSGAGYLIRPGPGGLDAAAFQDDAAAAVRLADAGDVAGAVAAWDRALAWWRGPALDGLTTRTLRAQATGLDERRLAARLGRAEQLIALDRNHAAVADLAVLCAEDTLREQPLSLLMQALYRCGRKADALAAYHALRTSLAEETGLDPSPDLQEVYRRILADSVVPAPRSGSGPEPAAPPDSPDPAADARTAPARPRPAAPRRLPAALRFFSGRAEHLAALDRMLAQQDPESGSMVISAIDGTAGVGKTALAVHWAHRVAGRFPDGQLYVNLRGFDPSGRPMQPTEALRDMLGALGVAEQRLPPDLDAQLAMYRSLLTGRRVLILLDNARDVDQVRPLLPRTAGPMAVVTSRRRLTGLAVSDGATPTTLDLLTGAEARDLLRMRVGDERGAAEPEALAAIAESCARLPLALNIAGANAAAHAGQPLAAFAGQLRDLRRRLELLDTGDPVTAVRTAFSCSYRHLDDAAARMFRLLGLAPGPDLGLPAAAVLAAVPPGEAQRTLGDLVRASLLSQTPAGRYTFHDLLRAYAVECAHEYPDESREALLRVLDYYLHSAYAADRRLFPGRDPLDLAPPQPGVVPDSPRDEAEALDWIEREWAALLAAAAVAADEGLNRHAWQIPWSLATFQARRGRWHEWRDTHRRALTVATAANDAAGRIYALRGLGRVESRIGDIASAERHLAQAVELAAETGDRLGLARTLTTRAWMFELTGRPQDALAAATRALEIFEELEHPNGRAEAYNTVGWYLALNKDYVQAQAMCARSLELLRALGHRFGEAGTLDSIGYIAHCRGDYDTAAEAYQRAIELFADVGDRTYEAGTIVRLGDTLAAAGDTVAARGEWMRGLRILEELDHPDVEDVRARLAE